MCCVCEAPYRRIYIADLGRLMEPLASAIAKVGGFIWFYVDPGPPRTVYTLALCGGKPCVVVTGQDMPPIQMSVEEYLALERDVERVRQLHYTVEYLLKQL